MNATNSDLDLGLALGFTNQCVQTRWNENNIGAGVNASSIVDMSFVASDPLSELVWSPQNGLSLKCADKKASLMWDVGPSYVAFSPSHSTRSKGSKDEKSPSARNFTASEGKGRVDSEVAKCARLAKSPESVASHLIGSIHKHIAGTGDCLEDVNNVEGVSAVDLNAERNRYNDEEKESLCSSKSIKIGNMAEAVETSAGQEDRTTKGLLPLLTYEPRLGTDTTEPLSGKFKEHRIADCDNKIEDMGSGSKSMSFDNGLASKIHSVKQYEALDSPIPNLPSSGRRCTELNLVINERKDKMKVNGSTRTSFLEKMESTAENDVHCLITKDGSGSSEERAQRGQSVLGDASLSDGRICVYQMKGKETEKSSSRREVNDRMSKDEDDSHGSMESCSSGNLRLKRKKRWGFDQPLICGSKRIKKQIQETPSANSLVRPNSSFMNWISNMVKGSAKLNREEGHAPALTFGHPNHEHESNNQKISSCNKTHDFGSSKMGFQSIFQSLYCPDTQKNEMKIKIDNCSIAGSKELVLVNKACGPNPNPISCHGVDDKFDFADQIACGNGEGISTHAHKRKIASNLLLTKGKDGESSSNSFHGKKKSRSNSSDPVSEGKPINNLGNASDPLGSLWITRFSTTTPCPVSNLDFSDLNSLMARDSLDEAVNVVGEELHNNGANTESCIGLENIKDHKLKKAIRLDSSGLLKSPEEMALVFPRRLDALKHIIPIAARENSSHATTTCFFCGKSGHYLRDCSEIKQNELEGLQEIISCYDMAAEGTPCLCIKCFQLDHWAATCPWAGSGRCFSMFGRKESQSKVSSLCNLRKQQMDTDKASLKGNGRILSEQRGPNSEEVQKHIASSSGKDKLIEEQLTPMCHLAGKLISDAPKGVFDTIRRLRLSRTDILKWMKSHAPVSHLNGFFLRLRVAKWEEGLGGAGYYVACITGTQRKKTSKSSKNSIRVSIEGVECLVASQYVSNNDFLEDELMAWWHKTSKNGLIPTEYGLKSKLEKRQKLGF